jgi:hypothetical protein
VSTGLWFRNTFPRTALLGTLGGTRETTSVSSRARMARSRPGTILVMTRREWIPLMLVLLLLALYLAWTWLDGNPQGRFEGGLVSLP